MIKLSALGKTALNTLQGGVYARGNIRRTRPEAFLVVQEGIYHRSGSLFHLRAFFNEAPEHVKAIRHFVIAYPVMRVRPRHEGAKDHFNERHGVINKHSNLLFSERNQRNPKRRNAQ